MRTNGCGYPTARQRTRNLLGSPVPGSPGKRVRGGCGTLPIGALHVPSCISVRLLTWFDQSNPACLAVLFVKRDVLTDAHCMWCRLAFQRALAKIEVVGRFCRSETNKVFGSGSISCDGPEKCVSLFAGEGGHCFCSGARVPLVATVCGRPGGREPQQRRHPTGRVAQRLESCGRYALAAMKISYTPIRVNRVKRNYCERGLRFDA